MVQAEPGTIPPPPKDYYTTKIKKVASRNQLFPGSALKKPIDVKIEWDSLAMGKEVEVHHIDDAMVSTSFNSLLEVACYYAIVNSSNAMLHPMTNNLGTMTLQDHDFTYTFFIETIKDVKYTFIFFNPL